MAKIRVHELAKEFNVSSKEMAEKIKELGYPIKNYMSTLEDYEVKEIRRRLLDEPGKDQEQEKPKKTGKIIRRRAKKVHIKIIKKSEDDEENTENTLSEDADTAQKTETGTQPEKAPVEVPEDDEKEVVEDTESGKKSPEPEKAPDNAPDEADNRSDKIGRAHV